jgi:Mg2+-importing ATPase
MAAGLRERPPTGFERSLHRFGALVLELTLAMVTLLVAANMALGRPWSESLLFSLALSMGLTPQLLPAIVTTTLARGARRMAGEGVVVKRLAVLEDFGSLDLLFSDKTGTITAGRMQVVGAVDVRGRPSDQALREARLNAQLETGFVNPIDKALRVVGSPPLPSHEKLDEVPYDFVRQRLAILVGRLGNHRIAQTIRPVIGACGDAFFERCFIHRAVGFGCRFGEDVQARQRRIRHLRVEGAGATAIGLLHHADDFGTQIGRKTLPRDIHHGADKTPKGIMAHKQFHLRFGIERHNAHRGLKQAVFIHLEQFIPWHEFKDGFERFARVA